MKVALLTTQYGLGGSGAEHQMARVLEALAERGWEPVVVARRTADDDGELGAIPVVRVGRPGTGPLNAAIHAVSAARVVQRWRPDVVVSLQLGSNPLAAVLARAVGRGRFGSVIRLTGMTPTGSQLEARGRSRAVRLATAAVLRRTDVVVSPARHMLDRAGPFAALISGRARVIPNGAPAVPDRGGAPVDGPVLWVGRDDAIKQVPHLVELARRMPDVRFSAVGIGPVEGAPENLVAEGRVSAEEVLDHLTCARAFVSTSKLEGVPNTLLEAAAAGVPLVAYDIPGNAEAVAGLTSGATLVPEGDVEALASAVRATLVGAPTVEGFVPRVDDVAEEWDDLLRSLAGGLRPG